MIVHPQSSHHDFQAVMLLQLYCFCFLLLTCSADESLDCPDYSQAKYSLTSLFNAVSGIHLPLTQAKGEEEVSSPNNCILDLFVGMVV